MKQDFDAYGSKLTINYEGQIANAAALASTIYGLVDVDLRPDAVADPTKLCVIPFVYQPCDETGCRYGTITAPAAVIIHLVQEALQAQLKIMLPDAAVPQTGKWDCKTAAYMVVAHQMITKTGVGEVVGWPLDSIDLREVLTTSASLLQALQQVFDNTQPTYGGTFSGFNIILPDDAKGLKFYRAEVPAECTVAAEKKTSWGLIAAVGIAVAGVVGATYAISQRRKTAKAKSKAV